MTRVPYSRTLAPAQREALAGWLRLVADTLWLRDWTIIVDDEAPDEPWANVRPTESYGDALIKIDASLLNETQLTIERVLVHELLHLHHGDLLLALRDATASADGAIQAMAEATVRRYVERMVDNLAKVIVASVPLPPLDDILAAAPTHDVVARPVVGT